MYIEIYDDINSIVHTILGFITIPFGLWVYVVFSAYELIEFMIKHNESIADFIGDLVEYFIGVAVFSLITGGIHGSIFTTIP